MCGRTGPSPSQSSSGGCLQKSQSALGALPQPSAPHPAARSRGGRGKQRRPVDPELSCRPGSQGCGRLRGEPLEMKDALVNREALRRGQALTITKEFCSGPQHSAPQALRQAPRGTPTSATAQAARTARPGISARQAPRPTGRARPPERPSRRPGGHFPTQGASCTAQRRSPGSVSPQGQRQ